MSTLIPSAWQIRKRILEMAFFGQSVHIPSAFSIVELVRTLHDKHLSYPDNNPNHPDRDFLVVSKGHGVMSLYPILEARGWIPRSAIDSYFAEASPLPGLYEASIPGCEANTGSLGQGVSVCVGLALSARLRRTQQRAYCIVGDGELNEGPVWEALMYAGHHRLSNFTMIIDKNNLQAMGTTQEVLATSNLESVLSGFGHRVITVDGHSETQINTALENLEDAPLTIIANTVKGKGVSFMENENSWHYKRLDKSTFDKSIEEIQGQT